MKVAWILIALSLAACAVSSCDGSTDEYGVLQKIPIKLQRGVPASFEIESLSGNGSNDVGIRCTPEIWGVLTKNKDQVSIRLISSDKSGTEINNVMGKDEMLWSVESVHFLFRIAGKRNANAIVEITFPGAPEGTTSAEVVVLKTPADTGP